MRSASAPASRSGSAEAADPPSAASAAPDAHTAHAALDARRRERRSPPERVLYARSQRQALERPPVAGGEPITEDIAVALRECVFGGSASAPPSRPEWLRAGLALGAAERERAWALAVPGCAAGGCGGGAGGGGGATGVRKCSLRALLAAVQALFLRWLLFPPCTTPPRSSASAPAPRHSRPGATHLFPPPPAPADRLRATTAEQREALSLALASALWRCSGDRGVTTVALPAAPPATPIATSSALLPDGITERLQLFEATSLDDLRLMLRRFIYVFQEESGPGCLSLLYSAVLTRGIHRVLQDLDGVQEWLLGSDDEGSPCVVTLLLTGRATPYLHNGVIYIGDEDHYALPRFGVLARAEVGLLLWTGSEGGGGGGGVAGQDEGPGSRLKTPQLPVWVSAAQGHFGVLFATDRELLRNYHAERSFQLHYYCMEAAPCLLGVDTNHENDGGECVGGGEAPRKRFDDSSRTSIERVICTKWPDAQVTWLKLPTPACPRLTQ